MSTCKLCGWPIHRDQSASVTGDGLAHTDCVIDAEPTNVPVNAERLTKLLVALDELLSECAEYFDYRADADGDSDGYRPNREMQLASEIRRMQGLEQRYPCDYPTLRAAIASVPLAKAVAR